MNDKLETMNNRLDGNATRQLAYQKLRQLLTCSGLQPGTRLGEIEWAERIGVHRGAVREAMAVLLHEGLLSRQGRSFVVPTLEDRDIKEVYQVRLALEVAALRMSIGRKFDENDFQPLVSLCKAMDHLMEADLFLGFSEADSKFHEHLVELSGNRRLVRVYRLAPLPHSKYGGAPPANSGPVLRKAQEEHVEICRCVCDGRINDAIRVLEKHLSVGWSLLPPHLKSLESASKRDRRSTVPAD